MSPPSPACRSQPRDRACDVYVYVVVVAVVAAAAALVLLDAALVALVTVPLEC